jgi:hypothetical protein
MRLVRTQPQKTKTKNNNNDDQNVKETISPSGSCDTGDKRAN